MYALATGKAHGAPRLAIADGLAVHGEDGAVGIGAFLHFQHIVDGGVGLTIVGQFQYEHRLRAGGDIGDFGGSHDAELGILHAHGGLVELLTLHVILRVGGSFIRIACLSASRAEDGSPSRRRRVDIHGQGREGRGVTDLPCSAAGLRDAFRQHGLGVTGIDIVEYADYADVVECRAQLRVTGDVPRGLGMLQVLGFDYRLLGGLADHRPGGDAEVANLVSAFVVERLELVLLVVANGLLPGADLLVGPLYGVGEFLGFAVRAVYNEIGRMTAGGLVLFRAPHAFVAVGASIAIVTLLQACVVSDLSFHFLAICIAVFRHPVQVVFDDGLPVGYERFDNILLGQHEGGLERQAGANA